MASYTVNPAAVAQARRLIKNHRYVLASTWGDRQPDAVRLYEKSGYTRIAIFPPYEAMPYSNCFEKVFVTPA